MKQLNNSSSFLLSQRYMANQGKILKILLIIAVCIGIIIALAFYFTSGLTDAARQQLSALKSGDVTSAYNMTSKAFKENTSLKQFEEFVTKTPILKNYSDVSFTERSNNNGTGYLKGTLKATDGSQMTIEYQLVKENDQWKIQAFKLSAAGLHE